MSSDKHILVTGGAGYIGSHACKALRAAGYTPVVYDNLSTGNRWAVQWGPFEQGDVLDRDRLQAVIETYKPLGVMHFAALTLVGESVKNPALYYHVNVTGALNLIELCRAHDIRAFVFSSTCAVYGQPEQQPIDEDLPPAPINPYGASKLMVENILTDYSRAYDLRYMALRYFNAAGADPAGEIGEHRAVETHLIPLMLDAVTGSREPLTIFGDDYATADGTAIRDYIHVTDLAEAHLRALNLLLEDRPSATVNLGTGRGVSVKQVLDTAERITGRAVPYSMGTRREGDPAALVANPARAEKLLGPGLTQRSSLDTIIETAWQWQQKRPAV